MAIKCKYETNSGVSLDCAYINIPNIHVSKQILFGTSKFVVTATALIYANEDAYRCLKQNIDSYSCQFDMTEESGLLTQVYNFLKNYEKFQEVEDC